MSGFQDLGGDTLKLVITSAEDYHETILNMVKELVGKNSQKGIYVTLNRSCRRLQDVFSKEGIPIENIFFVDAVSSLAGSPEEKENCSFVTDPQNLSELSISIFRNLEGLGGDRKKFLIFDSLSSLLLYNKDSHISKFLHSFTAELRTWNLNTVIVTIGGEFNQDTIRTFSGFFDEVIEIE